MSRCFLRIYLVNGNGILLTMVTYCTISLLYLWHKSRHRFHNICYSSDTVTYIPLGEEGAWDLGRQLAIRVSIGAVVCGNFIVGYTQVHNFVSSFWLEILLLKHGSSRGEQRMLCATCPACHAGVARHATGAKWLAIGIALHKKL